MSTSPAPGPVRSDMPAWMRPRFLIAAALTLAAVFIVLVLVVRVHEMLFLVFVAIVLATALDIPVRWLSRWMPRGIATVLALAFAVLLVAGTVTLAAPVIAAQSSDIAQQLPAAATRLNELATRWLGHAPNLAGAGVFETVTGWMSRATAIAGGVAAGIGAIVAVIFMAAFFTYQPRVYLDGVIELVPRPKRDAAREFLARVHPVLQGWMVGTLVSMVVMGILAAVGLKLLGVKAWFFLGVLTFAMEFIPYLGPIISGAAAVLFGLADSPAMALKVLILFTILQEVEGHTLVPFLMKRAVRLQPALLIAWQLCMAAAFGIYGLLVSTPLLAVLKVVTEYFYLERTLGEPRRLEPGAKKGPLESA